jgi:hypothetical protein
MIKVWKVFRRSSCYGFDDVLECGQNLDGVGNPDLYYSKRVPMIDGVLVDYFPVSGGDLVCSPRLRATIDAISVSDDAITWKLVTLIVPHAAPMNLWRLEFSGTPDVLDEERTIFDQWGDVRIIRRPVFAAFKCAKHSVFADRPNCRHAFCVTNVARRELGKLEPRKQFKFNTAPVSYDT